MPSSLPRAGFWRRIGALVYDWLLVASVLIIAQALYFFVVALLVWSELITLAPGQDIANYISGNRVNSLYLLSWIVAFYAYFWAAAGQTLGMKAWRLRVQNIDGSRLRPTQAVLRALAAMLGLGNLAVLLTSEQLAWQDKVADCEVVVLPKAVKSKSGPAAQ
ncbi:MAG: RDD family protein [Gammaproteobacteria bacterium]|nr:RDD family protein [Gammaproteobacteria bacterium]